jgi:FG-GAP-like repeat
VISAADFNHDGQIDYVLFNSSNHRTAIWYLSGRVLLRGAYGPTVNAGWALVATADFNGDGKPDYLLYNPSTRETVIWYMDNNVRTNAAFGPRLPSGRSLVVP